MKKFSFLFVGLFVLSASFATSAVVSPRVMASQVMIPLGNTGKTISLMDLSRISVKDFESLTGRNYNLFQEIGFKIAQKKMRNNINPDGTVNAKQLDKLMKASNPAITGDKYLRLMLIFLAIAVGLWIIGLIVPGWPYFLWVLSYLASLAAAIFFVLWLVNKAGGI